MQARTVPRCRFRFPDVQIAARIVNSCSIRTIDALCQAISDIVPFLQQNVETTSIPQDMGLHRRPTLCCPTIANEGLSSLISILRQRVPPSSSDSSALIDTFLAQV